MSDDRRYSCECIVILQNLEKVINELNKPSDNNHKIVYIVNSDFFKKYISIMRYSSKNKFVTCDELYEINFDNENNKNVIKHCNIKVELTYNCPNDASSKYIPHNSYIMCASFGKIKKHPRIQLGITEGSTINEIIYRNSDIVPSKPKNNNWKFKTANRGIKEELGICRNLYWKCINEQLFNWSRSKWVATLIANI